MSNKKNHSGLRTYRVGTSHNEAYLSTGVGGHASECVADTGEESPAPGEQLLHDGQIQPEILTCNEATIH